MRLFDRVARFHPGLEASQDGINLFKSVMQQEERRTGARMLVGSGTVGDDPPVLFQGDAVDIILKFVQRNGYGSDRMCLRVGR